MNRSIFILSFICITALMIVGCSQEEKDVQCYEFDQRSCNGDEWGELVTDIENWDERLIIIQNFLEEKGIPILSINVDEDFHEVVCLACVVCPDGPRFYIEVEEGNREKLENMDLLNFQETNCS